MSVPNLLDCMLAFVVVKDVKDDDLLVVWCERFRCVLRRFDNHC